MASKKATFINVADVLPVDEMDYDLPIDHDHEGNPSEQVFKVL